MHCEICKVEMERTPTGVVNNRGTGMTNGKPSKARGWQCPQCRSIVVHPWCPLMATHETWRPQVSTADWLAEKLNLG